MPLGFGKGGGGRQQYNAWNVGLDFAYSVIGMVLLGLAIDYFAGSSPTALLICTGLGLLGGGYRFIREALAMNRTPPGGGSRRAPVAPKPGIPTGAEPGGEPDQTADGGRAGER